MEKLILKNGKVMDEHFDLIDADVVAAGGKIEEVGKAKGEGLDCTGCTVVPGFVDVHIHASVGSDTCDADAAGLHRVAEFLATKGVTTFCPTTMTVAHKDIEAALASVKKAMETPHNGADIAGVNLEGPFINESKKGAQRAEYVRCPDWNVFKAYFDGCGGIIKLVDIAPECDGADHFIENAKEICTVSIAHTNADYACAMRAFGLGITHVTHMYNAMNGLTHREPGVVGAVFDSDQLPRAELICDGFHIHPATLRITFKVLGEDRICIVSDAIRATGGPDGESELGGQTVYVNNGQARLKDGTIAGSTTNMHTEVKNLVSYGVPFRSAIKAATINPAKQIREDHRIGSIAVGKDADLVVLDENLEIKYVITKGKVAFRA